MYKFAIKMVWIHLKMLFIGMGKVEVIISCLFYIIMCMCTVVLLV